MFSSILEERHLAPLHLASGLQNVLRSIYVDNVLLYVTRYTYPAVYVHSLQQDAR